jgi:MYXO-CTERM domain-containing protein
VAANQAGDDRYSAAPQMTERVSVTAIDDGCGCHASSGGTTPCLGLLVVVAVSRRRRRSW